MNNKIFDEEINTTPDEWASKILEVLVRDKDFYEQIKEIAYDGKPD